MSRTAIVNYHIHKPERQAFELDAGGIVGNLVSPELIATEVKVQDVREPHNQTAFKRDSVGFTPFQTKVNVLDDSLDWKPAYDSDIKNLLKNKLDPDEIIVFDHTVRVDSDGSTRKPVRNAHSDYSRAGARQRLIDLLGPERAATWAAGHYAFINVWRPIESEINSSPLGFVLPKSVKEEDWILLDLIYPDREGQILGLAANPGHKWIYKSRMTPHEVAYFNIFDNQGQPSVAHSALDMIEDPEINVVRRSIESRTVVRYRDGHSNGNSYKKVN